MENAQPKSGYGSWIIGMMLLAYVATSFDFRHFSFGSPLVTVGSEKIGKQTLVERIRQEKALAQLSLSNPVKKNDVYWMQKVVMDAIWDQEANALGIDVSDQRAKDSLRQKMCFLNESGHLNLDRLRLFYQRNPHFLKYDVQATEHGSSLGCDVSPYPNLFRGSNDLLEQQDRFNDTNMAAFFRNNGVTLLQMVAAEKRQLKRLILNNALARNVLLPNFYKDLSNKGVNQVRTWRYRLFPMDSQPIAQEQVKKEQVDLFLKNGAPQEMLNAPEMRTFAVWVSDGKKRDGKQADEAKEPQSVQAIQDAIGSGKTLQDVASQQGGQCVVITTSKTGQALDFSPILWQKTDGSASDFSETERAQILQRVFQGKAEDVYTLPLAERSVWIQLQRIDPPQLLNEQALYAAATYAVKKQKSEQRIAAKAWDFAKKLEKNQKGFLKNNAALGMTQQESSAIDGVVSDEMMEIFQMTSAPMVKVLKTDRGYQVVQLVSIRSGALKDGVPNDRKVDQVLDRQWIHAFFSSYFAVLQKKFKIVWNDKALEQWLAPELAQQQEADLGADQEDLD